MSNQLIVKHIASELHCGNLDRANGIVKAAKQAIPDLIQTTLINLPKEEKDLTWKHKEKLSRLASVIYPQCLSTKSREWHPLESKPEIVSRILSFLSVKKDVPIKYMQEGGPYPLNLQRRVARNNRGNKIWAVARVNKLFNDQVSFTLLDLMREKLASRKMSFVEIKDMQTALDFPSAKALLAFFPKECAEAEALDLTSYSHLSPEKKEVALCFSRLTHVDLSHIAWATSSRIIERAPQLRSLIISKVYVNNLKTIADCCGSLEQINFSGKCGDPMPDEWKDYFAARVPHLKSISLGGEWGNDAWICAIAAHCKELTSLDNEEGLITDRGLLALGKGCPKLSYLNLKNCHQITRQGAIAWAEQNVSNLTHLNLSHSRLHLDGVIEVLSQNCPQLQHFHAHSCWIGDTSLSALARHCPDLISLDVPFCEFTDEGVIAFAAANTRLKDINISKTANLTDQSVIALLSHSPLLERIDLKSCPQLSPKSIQALVKHCPHVKSINLSSCSWVTEESLSDIAKAYPHLEEIELAGCTDLGKGVQALARNCPRLKMLTGILTSAHLKALYVGCPEMPETGYFKSQVLKPELVYPAQSSLAKLYQSILRRDPWLDIQKFLKDNKDLNGYHLNDGERPINLFLRLTDEASKFWHSNQLPLNDIAAILDALALQKKSDDEIFWV